MILQRVALFVCVFGFGPSAVTICVVVCELTRELGDLAGLGRETQGEKYGDFIFISPEISN